MASVDKCQRRIMKMRTRVSSSVTTLFSDMREANLTNKCTVEY